MPEKQRLLFGTDAELFDRVRPSYPAELIDEVVALVGRTARAVDAGCGTGKATVMLAERGVRGVGVDPHPAMARIAAEKLGPFAGWRVDVADFEDWQPRPGDPPFDLVTAAQAWHWIDRERGTRQAERLLRPGGWLAIFGHRMNAPDTPLRRAIDAIHDELTSEPAAIDRAPRERVPPGSAFGPPIEWEYPGWQDYTAA
jgi:SAM-dependent methyltransferase